MTEAIDPDERVCACPLCDGHDADEVERVPWETIDRALADFTGSAPPDSTRSGATGSLRRLHCATCGLEYFSPLAAGDAAFYAYLSSGAGYYDVDRWDFDRAARRISPTDDVADLGCGAGAFLAGLPGAGRRFGADTNPSAVEDAVQRGVEAILSAPCDVPPSLDASFDVVCALQTVEHLTSVREVMEPALRLIRPGGLLMVSVPNRRRTPVNETPVLDWPPHHVSRWAPEHLSELARRWELEVVAIEVEQRSALRTVGLASYVALRASRGRPAVRTLDDLRPPLASWHGLRHGHTMMGVFRRTERQAFDQGSNR